MAAAALALQRLRAAAVMRRAGRILAGPLPAAPQQGANWQALSRLPLEKLQALSRLPLEKLQALSRLPLEKLQALSRLPLEKLQALSRLQPAKLQAAGPSPAGPA